MTIDEHKADIWRSVHGLIVETMTNNLAQTRHANEQLLAANSKLAAELAELKARSQNAAPA